MVLEGARVCIQGFGAVGSHAARFLSARGARIVAVSDSAGCIMDEAGLDVASLIALKAAARSVNEHRSGRAADREAVIEVPCDIWIPAARPDVIHVGNVERIQTRMIVSGANIPITADAERRLHERGVLLVPDFIANAGGVICAAVEYRGGDQSTAMATIEQKVRVNTQLVLQRATTASMTTRRAAEELARERIVAAMSLRRWR